MRYEKFDILRGFAIIAVVLIHVTAPLATDGDVVAIIINQISRFAVPVFFILSGWGLTVAESYEKSEGYWDFLKARFLGVFPQYILWNFIYLAYSDVWTVESLGEFIQALLLGTIYNHLYFVPVILALYVVYPLVLKYVNKVWVSISLLITIISQISEIWIQHEYFYMNRNIFNWIFYFIFGVWLAKDFRNYIERLQKYKLPIYVGLVISVIPVLLTPFLVGDTFDYNLTLASTRPTVIFYSIMVVLFMIVARFEHEKINNIMLTLSKYSFYIYLSHYLFLSLTRRVYLDLELDIVSILYISILLVIVTIISLAAGKLIRRGEKKIGL
ncbi:MAG TPA: acyltransferase [Atopostipes sp.]|nr:acyltransferase [Atopostipes sp.]